MVYAHGLSHGTCGSQEVSGRYSDHLCIGHGVITKELYGQEWLSRLHQLAEGLVKFCFVLQARLLHLSVSHACCYQTIASWNKHRVIGQLWSDHIRARVSVPGCLSILRPARRHTNAALDSIFYASHMRSTCSEAVSTNCCLVTQLWHSSKDGHMQIGTG